MATPKRTSTRAESKALPATAERDLDLMTSTCFSGLPSASARSRARSATLCLLAALAGAGMPSWAAAPALPSTNVDWIPAAADADIERCFARAKAENKPVLPYWGAAWCPPCNQLESTLFNRQDFAAQSRSFVAVHLDGDRLGAQKLGARFKVIAYPTVILFRPDGAEITRLPGDVDAPKLMALLQAGLAGGRPVKEILAGARARKPLSVNEWRLLAFYERSARSLRRVVEKLASWNAMGEHAAPVRRLQGRLGGACAKLGAGDPQRATCESLLKDAPEKA